MLWVHFPISLGKVIKGICYVDYIPSNYTILSIFSFLPHKTPCLSLSSSSFSHHATFVPTIGLLPTSLLFTSTSNFKRHKKRNKMRWELAKLTKRVKIKSCFKVKLPNFNMCSYLFTSHIKDIFNITTDPMYTQNYTIRLIVKN